MTSENMGQSTEVELCFYFISNVMQNKCEKKFWFNTFDRMALSFENFTLCDGENIFSFALILFCILPFTFLKKKE